MPAPTTADELLDLVLKSNLVEEPRLRAYAEKLRESGPIPTDPAKLAQYLVRDGILTYFQAEQLLQGKYKRFSLGKYKVLERLGSGGMGTVFLCEHKLMRRRVAVKVLPLPKSEDKASLDRFIREAKAAGSVDHPNIVRTYDLDRDDNLHFIVMEWVDGTNLQDLVKKFGPLDVLRACHYIYGAAVGLQHAHEVGLIHRDIKPGNILVDRSGVVKILDLGLARLTHDTEDNLTRQNDENVLGTADYLAPEQAMDSHTVDIRADIYSLGATFYFLLTGSPPFPEGSVAQKLIWHQNRPPRPVKMLRNEVPDEVVAVVEKMMDKDPARRYRTPAEVMAALAPWVATPIPPPSEREMPTLSPAVAGMRTTAPRGPLPAPSAGAPSLIGAPRVVTPGSNAFSEMPTAVGTATPRPQPAAPPPPDSPAVWSTLEGDTQSVARGDTAKPPPKPEELPDEDEEERPSRVARRARERQRDGGNKGKIVLIAAGGAALLAVLALGGWLLVSQFSRKSDKGDPNGGGTQNPTTPGPRKITVSKAGGENAVGTLREALMKVAPGETVVIAEPRLTEPGLRLDRHRHKDVTIESAVPGGKPAVIEFLPPTGGKGGVMFDANSVEGLRVRNVEFDGKSVAEFGVQAAGVAPGTTFEGVTVRNVLKAGFHVYNAAGTAERPLALDRVRVVLLPQTEAGVLLVAGGALDNKFISVRNSRFEGPGGSGIGVRVEGPAVDLDVSHNRFFGLGAAAWFVRPAGKVSKGTFANNTVYKANVGLMFESPPNEGQYQFRVAHNYFAQTQQLLQAKGPVPGLTGEGNAHDAASQPGNPPLPGAEKRDAPTLTSLDPADDATFLRFPGNTAPTAGPNKSRVGAQ